MELNTTIWGTKDDNAVSLTSGSSQNACFYSNKAGASDIKAYYDTYGHDNPIDESVNYWQISDDSMFNSFCFLRLTGQTNVLDISVVRAVNPLSIFLTKVGSTQRNVTFNQSANSNTIWENDVYGSSFYSQYWKIIPWYDYNRILLRPSLTVVKLDADGKPTGSVISTGDKSKIYNFFHDDENGSPIREQYAILALNIRFLLGNSGSDIFNYDSYDYLYFSTSTEIESPYPNAYRTNPFRTYQTLGSMLVGFGGLNLHSFLSNVGAFGMNTNTSMLYIYDPRYWEIVEYQNDQNQTRYFTRFTGSYNDLMKQIATLGFWFRDDVEGGTYSASGVNAKTIGENCVDDSCCLPEIIGGRTTGNFKRGRQAGADPQAQWGADWRNNVGYTGDKPYKSDDRDGGDLTSQFNRPSISGTCRYYNFTTVGLRDLGDFINSGYQPTDAEFINDFKGVNPADYIATCIYYPTGFTCPNLPGATAGVSIGALTPVDTGISAYLADVTPNYISYAPYTITAKYNDFRDYAPYTTLDLYVPFCGNIELDTAEFIGHTVQVYLLIDYPTGNCTAVVMRDSMIYDTINGTIGVTVPLTAQNMGSWQNSIKSAEIALKQAELQRKTAWLAAAGSSVSLVAGVATMNPLAIAGGVGGLIGTGIGIEKANLAVENAQYQLSHTAAATRSISAASPANGLCLDYDCHLLIKRPIMANGFDDEIYSHTVGNACAITDYLSSFSGLTVVAEADLSGISAPAEIKSAILSALKNGVYI